MEEILPESGSVKVNIYIACRYMKTVIVNCCAMWASLHIPGNLNKLRDGRQIEHIVYQRPLDKKDPHQKKKKTLKTTNP